MKKIEDLYFTVSIILSSARNFEQFHFFYQLLEIDTWNTYGILFFVEQLTFFCRADDFFKKSVEQLRFEQMHFEQLTLTQQDSKRCGNNSWKICTSKSKNVFFQEFNVIKSQHNGILMQIKGFLKRFKANTKKFLFLCTIESNKNEILKFFCSLPLHNVMKRQTQ